MSKIDYPASSPYAATPQSISFIGRFQFRPIPTDATDQQIILQERHQYRPDRLSYDLYGTPVYWWIFCVRNPSLRSDPIWGFVTGLVITVPTLEYLRQVLGN